MQYGTMINNQLIVHKERKDGDKPIIETEAPSREGYYPVYSWREDETQITQVWTLIEDTSEPDPPKPEMDADETDFAALGREVIGDD